MLSASSLSFVVLGVVVRNCVFGTPTAQAGFARNDVGYCVYGSGGSTYPFVRISFGRVVIFSGSSALCRVSTVPMLKSLWITTTVPPGLRISR